MREQPTRHPTRRPGIRDPGAGMSAVRVAVRELRALYSQLHAVRASCTPCVPSCTPCVPQPCEYMPTVAYRPYYAYSPAVVSRLSARGRNLSVDDLPAFPGNLRDSLGAVHDIPAVLRAGHRVCVQPLPQLQRLPQLRFLPQQRLRFVWIVRVGRERFGGVRSAVLGLFGVQRALIRHGPVLDGIERFAAADV